MIRKIISTNMHRYIDYGAAVILVLGAWIFHFNEEITATVISVCAGIAIAVVSFFTRYEGGKVWIVSMEAHLKFDLLLGIFLIASPWIFGFSSQTYLFHLIMGLASLLAGLFTRIKPPENSLEVEKA